MNIIQVIGNLGKEPETRYTPSGQKVTTLTIAGNSKRGGKEETTWWRVTLWGDKFDKMLTYLKKGSMIMVIGEMHKPEIFTNRDGQPQLSLEITADAIRFLPLRTDKPGQEGEKTTSAFASSYEQVQPVMAGKASFSEDPSFEEHSEDSLPF